MTYYIQIGTSILAMIALLWIIAGFLYSVFDPPDYGELDEHETMNGPGLPHHRGLK